MEMRSLNNLLFPALPGAEDMQDQSPVGSSAVGRFARHAGDLKSIAFLSTMPPQRCGLATFAADLIGAVKGAAPQSVCNTVTIVDGQQPSGSCSPFTVTRHHAASYARAGAVLNAAGTDLLCVQHEYGIFGGPDGEMLLDLLETVDAPVVVTLHTVLERPSPNQRRVMDAVLDRASRVVVMTERSARTIQAVHGVERDRLRIVPHGIPSMPVASRAACRQQAGLCDRPTLLTFGLLSPGKGIEHAIRALPALVRSWPDVLYVVLGATHPNLVRENGEAYRDSLIGLARTLGVTNNVRFVDRFVDLPELMVMLKAADIYVTPYVNEAQSVSGTLSYSYGIGTPVVSTPYHHAVELLADGRGVLVPFADPDAIADAVAALLADPVGLAQMGQAARLDSERMLWPRVGERYLEIFGEVMADAPMVRAS